MTVLPDFFILPTPLSPLSSSIASIDGSATPTYSSSQLPAIQPINDVVKVFFKANDCAIDYNPTGLSSRAVLAFDAIKLSTTILSTTPNLSLKIALRDGVLYAIDHSPKPEKRPGGTSLLELQGPYLQRVTHQTLFEYLEENGFARLATTTNLEVAINLLYQTLKPKSTDKPFVKVMLSHGPVSSDYKGRTEDELTLYCCSDSLQTLNDIVNHFLSEVQADTKVAEVDIVMYENPGDHLEQEEEKDEEREEEEKEDDEMMTGAGGLIGLTIERKESKSSKSSPIKSPIKSPNKKSN